jgi:hypothetical protein
MSEPNEMDEIGNAFIRLGWAIKNNRDTDIDPEVLAELLRLAPRIPKVARTGPPKWSEEKDPLGAMILRWIRTGEDDIPTGAVDKDTSNALTRLRRNGLIKNEGTRASPIWRLTTEDEQKEILEAGQLKRKHDDAERQKRSYTNVVS